AAPAIEILTTLASKDPADAEIHRLLAKALDAAGQGPQAGGGLDRAAARPPAEPQRAVGLAPPYPWLKRADPAAGLFARVREARPIPQTHVLIGRAYRDAGEYDRARAELDAALRQDPAVRRAHYYLGMVMLEDARAGPDRVENALAEFRAELLLAP